MNDQALSTLPLGSKLNAQTVEHLVDLSRPAKIRVASLTALRYVFAP